METKMFFIYFNVMFCGIKAAFNGIGVISI